MTKLYAWIHHKIRGCTVVPIPRRDIRESGKSPNWFHKHCANTILLSESDSAGNSIDFISQHIEVVIRHLSGCLAEQWAAKQYRFSKKKIIWNEDRGQKTHLNDQVCDAACHLEAGHDIWNSVRNEECTLRSLQVIKNQLTNSALREPFIPSPRVPAQQAETNRPDTENMERLYAFIRNKWRPNAYFRSPPSQYAFPRRADTAVCLVVMQLNENVSG